MRNLVRTQEHLRAGDSFLRSALGLTYKLTHHAHRPVARGKPVGPTLVGQTNPVRDLVRLKSDPLATLDPEWIWISQCAERGNGYGLAFTGRMSNARPSDS
jgi:hypothetical protein